MPLDNKLRINVIKVEPSTHQWLIQQSNQAGKQIGSHVGHLLDAMCLDWDPDSVKDLSPDQRVFWNWLVLRRKKRSRERVYQAAAIYLEDPDDASADILASMCEDAGLSYQEVIREVGQDPFSSIIISVRNGSKFGTCLRWLPTTLLTHGGRARVAILSGMAQRRGFTMSMVNRARRAINASDETPQIVSKKEGKSWVWEIQAEKCDDDTTTATD